MDSIAVLLMAYGGPNSLEEVEPYILDVRGGRATPRELVKEIRNRYQAIGGRSPLLDITRAQAQALEEELDSRAGRDFRVYVGMRHWHPYIKEAVAHIVANGHRQMVAICMAPHYSKISIGAYFRRLEEATASLNPDLQVARIEHWYDHPHLIAGLQDKVQKGIRRFPEASPEKVTVIFTAHSLPARILQEADPYPEQLVETAKAVAESLGLAHWQVAYQSASQTGEAWLEPSVEEVITKRAESEHRQFLLAPIGFVADNVEVLYDLDIAARQMAVEQGIYLERAELLNTSPHLIAALRDLVESSV